MNIPEFETFTLTVADAIVTMTLNRPQQMNAFNLAMMQGLIRAFDLTYANDDVRAVIVTGASKAFCAGADLSSGEDTFDYDQKGRDNAPDPLTNRVHRDSGVLVHIAGGGAVHGAGMVFYRPSDQFR